MHDYLRAVGFANIKENKALRGLLKLAEKHPSSEYVSSPDDAGIVYGEKLVESADRMGINICGEYDENGIFYRDYFFPFFRGKNTTFKGEVSIEKQSDRDAYSGVCDHIHMGVSVIFQLLNRADYVDNIPYKYGQTVFAPVILSGLSVYGRIILPLASGKEDKHRGKKDTKNRDMRIDAARNGDKEAIESLTLEDMDTYATVMKRTRKEDVLTIVSSYFMPYGIACDQSSVLGEILEVQKVQNSITLENVYILTIDCNDLIFDVCINSQDLLGEPMPGRRFRGNIWLQGIVDFMQ